MRLGRHLPRGRRRAALAAGASFVNDYTGGHDPELAGVVADAGAGLVVTHYRGRPRSNPSRSYEATVDEVLRFLEAAAARAVAAGVGERSVLVDPGLGFGKSTRLDLALMRDLDRITALGFPVLAAVSHKEFTADASGLPEDDAARHGRRRGAGAPVPAWRCCGCTTSRSWPRCCDWPTRSAERTGP